VQSLVDSWDENHSQKASSTNEDTLNFESKLRDSNIFRIQQMAHTVANYEHLFACIGTSRAQRLHELDIEVHGTSYFSDYSTHKVYYSESAVKLRRAAWHAWFVQRIEPNDVTGLPIRNLKLSGHSYSGSMRDGSIYRVLVPLLSRLPHLQKFDLSLEMDYLPPVEIDLDTSLPQFSELRELTVGDMALPVFKALLAKMGARFERLNVTGCLTPNRQEEDPLTVVGEEDPGDRLSVTATSRASTRAGHLRPVDLLELVRDLSPLASTSPSGEPVRIRHLRVTTWQNIPRHKKHAMRIAQSASFLRGTPLLAQLHSLVLDRPTFSALCGFAHIYLSDNPLPSTIRFFKLRLEDWSVELVETDVFGKDCTRVDQAFEVLRLQIERGEARGLRRVTVALKWLARESEDLRWATEDQGLWKEFKATCQRRRIQVHFGVVDEGA